MSSDALRAIRQLAGLTQVDLGKESGVDASYISRIEAGQRKWPAPRVTKALAAALGVPVTALLDRAQEAGQQ